MKSTVILGTTFSFTNNYKLFKERPLIIISNHQSMFDIPPLIWYFRAHPVKFVSKKELGKGIPSVSYNLRHGGSALIDRKDAKKSLEILEDFAERVNKNNWAATIFPEGTRSRTGIPKPFKNKGLITLFKKMPNALVVPVTINNSWKLNRYGNFPMGLGAVIKIKTHKPLEIPKEGNNFEEFIKELEQTIIADII